MRCVHGPFSLVAGMAQRTLCFPDSACSLTVFPPSKEPIMKSPALAGLLAAAILLPATCRAQGKKAAIETVPVSGNVEQERKRIAKDLDQTLAQVDKIERQLQNEDFLTKAKPDVVAMQKNRRKELLEKIATLEKHLEEL